MKQRLTFLLLPLALTAEAHAQRALRLIDGTGFDEAVGAALVGPGDLDGGGRPDLLIGDAKSGRIRRLLGEGGASEFVGPAGVEFGATLAGGADLDGDGRPDFVVGAPARSSGGAGAIHVYAGDDFSLLWSAAGVSGDELGASIALFGDTTGDGAPEILVGAPAWNAQTGRVLLYDGASGALLTTRDGANPGDRFGASLAVVDDANGDGIADVAIGVPGDDAASVDAGAVELHSSITMVVLWTDAGSVGGGAYGASLASAGDVNFDGVPDLVAGAPGASASYVRLLGGSDGAHLGTWSGQEGFGTSVAGGVDLDGDCLPEVVIGSPLEDGAQGRARVYSAASGALLALYGGFWNNSFPAVSGGMGTSVALVDDFDGDGFGEFAAGGPQDSHFSFQPRFGHAVLAALDPGQLARGEEEGGTGEEVRFIGDVNADGRADLIVSRPVRILSGADGSELVSLHAGAARVAGIGDVNGDGVPDVVVQPNGAMTVRSGADGSIIHSLPFGYSLDAGPDADGDGVGDLVMATSSEARLYSGATGALLQTIVAQGSSLPSEGRLVALIGDQDGDGRADILFGDPLRDTTFGWNQGRVGTYSGMTGALIHEIEDPMIEGQFGLVVADAGDYDGDGTHDWAVCASGIEPLRTVGQVKVISGATHAVLYESAVVERLTWGVRPNQAFGYSLRSAGDLDLDGRDELLIGDPFAYGLGYNLWAAGQVRVVGQGYSDTFWGFDGYDLLGFGLDGGMDADGDGLPDIALGVPAPTGNPWNGDGSTTAGARVLLRSGSTAETEVTRYCPRSPNSEWPCAILDVEGSRSIAENGFGLTARHAVSGSIGIFFMGTLPTELPFGDGHRCVGGGIQRFYPPVSISGPDGGAVQSVNFGAAPGERIQAGSTWYFQFWYRDVAAGGAGWNLSDALAVRFRS